MNNSLFALMSLLLFTAFFTISCMNTITDTDDSTDGQIPIKVSSQIENYLPVSRMNGTTFETDDAIGLYLISQPNTLTKKRHLDNVRFAYKSGDFVPETEVYFPYGEGKCNLYSYYPYRTQGIASGDSTLFVSVKTDQSKLSDYLASDFLVAFVPGITPTKTAVKLPHSHKMCKLLIEIVLKGEKDITQLEADNPKLTLLEMPTTGIYDFVRDKILSQAMPQDISLHGEWKVEGEVLTGKSALLIPCTLEKDYKLLTFQVGSRSFSGILSSGFLLQAGTVCTLRLTFDSKIGIKKMETFIEPWKDGEAIDMETKEDNADDLVPVSEANFRATHVLDVLCQKDTVGVLCKEYLRSADVDAQAIVLYPVSGGKTDWAHGRVLRLLGKAEKVHGGTVSWDKQTNGLTYVAGTSSPYQGIYVSHEKKIVFAKPEHPLAVSLVKRYLKDVRGDERTDYPVAKIGMQYWMRSNLRTRLYTDETNISLLNDTDVAPGYRENAGYYYNIAAVQSGKLSPAGWHLPTKSQWGKLLAYVGDSKAALKGGDRWGISYPDLAGFNSEAVSLFGTNASKSKSGYLKGFRGVCYWLMEKGQEGLFLAEGRDITYVEAHPLYGLSVRCVREVD